MPDPAANDPAEDGAAPPPAGRFSRFLKLSTLSTGMMATSALGKLRKAFSGGGVKAAAIEAETHLANAMKLVATMGELKGAVMKIGQVLSIQEDAIPREFRDVLSKLQTQAPPMHPAYAIDVIERELGRKIAELFADFERKPFAAASLGQVHRATLKETGEAVVVKVQYPGIDETIESDLKLAAPVVKALALTGKSYDMREMLEEVQARLREEVDYVHEAENQEMLREALAPCPHVVVPRVIRSHSARRVITMERLTGLHLDAFAAATEGDQARRDAAAEKLSDVLWRMQVDVGILHADPHPGNFLFLEDGRIGLLDFGCVKVLPDSFIRNYLVLLRAVLARNDAAILDAYERMGFIAPGERSNDRVKEWLTWSYLSCQGLLEDRTFPDPARGESWGKFIQDLHACLNRIIFKLGTYTPRDAVYLNRVTLGIMCFWARLEVKINWHRVMMRHVESAEARLRACESIGSRAHREGIAVEGKEEEVLQLGRVAGPPTTQPSAARPSEAPREIDSQALSAQARVAAASAAPTSAYANA